MQGMTKIARLESRALIRVSGPDARPFLHNLLTQDVEGLGEAELRYGALLSAPGRLLFELFVWAEAGAVVLDVLAARREALIQRLSMYRLRARVEITGDSRPVLAGWPERPPPGFQPDPRLAGLGWRGLGEGGSTADEATWRAHELDNGVPGADDMAWDKDYPIEANLDLLNGIDFAKGCFIGQETTSRMKRRGAIRNRMMPVSLDGPPPAFGSEVLLDGDRRAGEMRGGLDGLGMALLRLDRLNGGLTVEGRPIRSRQPAWMAR